MPRSSRPRPATSSTSPIRRDTTITPAPTTSSTSSSSNTVSSSPGSRLVVLGAANHDAPRLALYDAAFKAAGLAATVEAEAIEPRELGRTISALRGDPRVLGAAVGMPHTVPISRMLDGLGPEAQVIKAVNTVSHKAGALIGWNTDRAAFALALDDAGYQPKGRTVLMLGSGGAARATVDALRASAPKIWVASRDLDEARALCHDLGVVRGGPAPLGSLSLLVRTADLIVNATPVGSDGKSTLFPVEWINPAQFVFDLVYQPPLTPLVRGARERGARAVNGLTMLLYQGLAAFEIWTGRHAPEDAMRTALELAAIGRPGP